MTTYYTAWAYDTETGKTRRSQRRHADPNCARLAAERLIPAIPADPWAWTIGGRGATRPTDEEAGRTAGDWQLVVRKHRAPNLRNAP